MYDSKNLFSLDTIEQWIKKVVALVLKFFFRSLPLDRIVLDGVKSILVIRQHDQLGDMLCAVPLLRALRERFQSSHITLVASPVNYDVMVNHPYVDTVLNYNKRQFYRSPSMFLQFYRELRSRAYDVVVVPATVSVSLTSNLIAFFSRAKIRIGPESVSDVANSTSFLFNVRVPLEWKEHQPSHQTLRNLDILKPLNVSTDNLGLVIGLASAEQQEAKRFLASLRAEHKLLVGFHPGAGKKANCWQTERFAEVANILFERFLARTVITAGPMDDESVNAMLRHIRSPHLLIRNKPIRLVAAIVNELNLFITNDTGIMHVAAATSAPTLSLFGPTDPLQWAPKGTKNRYIYAESKNVEDITVQQVFDAAKAMLSLV